MSFCALNTSMLINGRVYLIQMRRDDVGRFWKFDVEDVLGNQYALDLNTHLTDFDAASYVVEATVRRLGE